MRPRVIIYNAVSIDGRVDWLDDSHEVMYTYYGLCPHWKVDAIFIGSNTIMPLGEHEEEATAIAASKPAQNPPPPGAEHLVPDPKPLLVVPDSRGRIHNWRLLQKEPWWRDILVLCTRATPSSYLEYLTKRQISYLTIGENKVDIPAALDILQKEYAVDSIRIDSGGSLNGVFIENDLVDEVSVLICPYLAGGTASISINTPITPGLKKPDQWQLKHLEKIQHDYVWLIYEKRSQ